MCNTKKKLSQQLLLSFSQISPYVVHSECKHPLSTRNLHRAPLRSNSAPPEPVSTDMFEHLSVQSAEIICWTTGKPTFSAIVGLDYMMSLRLGDTSVKSAAGAVTAVWWELKEMPNLRQLPNKRFCYLRNHNIITSHVFDDRQNPTVLFRADNPHCLCDAIHQCIHICFSSFFSLFHTIVCIHVHVKIIIQDEDWTCQG